MRSCARPSAEPDAAAGSRRDSCRSRGNGRCGGDLHPCDQCRYSNHCLQHPCLLMEPLFYLFYCNIHASSWNLPMAVSPENVLTSIVCSKLPFLSRTRVRSQFEPYVTRHLLSSRSFSQLLCAPHPQGFVPDLERKGVTLVSEFLKRVMLLNVEEKTQDMSRDSSLLCLAR